MEVEVKLYANLTKYLPEGATRNTTRIELPEGATIATVLEYLHIPLDMARSLIVLVNQDRGNFTSPLNQGDKVNVFPPIAGGA